MIKFVKTRFCDTQLNDRMIFTNREPDNPLSRYCIYRRICEIGGKQNQILWCESVFGQSENSQAYCDPNHTEFVYVIKEDA